MTLSLNWCFQERVLKLGHNINKNVAPGGVFRKKDEKLVLVHKLNTILYAVCACVCYGLQLCTTRNYAQKLLHHAASSLDSVW